MTTPIPHLGNPNDQSLKEYIVTLKDFKDSQSFYDDMETPGGNLYIPDRMVECCNRRPISRNTHYMLTYDEAKEIRNDPRVLTVELNYKDLGVEIETHGFMQTSNNFDKRVASDPNDINWGILRLNRKDDIPNWGIDGTVNQSATVIMDASGKNVDVVVMDDGCPYPDTYEYSQNKDGTGYSRMIEYNWFQLNPVVNGNPAGNYSYSTYRLQEHGSHTSGNCAGNTQGFAKDANIYNLTYGDSIDYVREFHKNKPINPITGLKNPTIMNNSWGYRLSWNSNSIISVYYRGTLYNKPIGGWTSEQLEGFRIRIGASLPVQIASTDADMVDAMNEGVIIVASAGNSYWYVDVPGGPDYNNYLVISTSSFAPANTYYYHRGSSPGSASGGSPNNTVICSGAIGQHNEPLGQSIYNSTGIEIGDYKAEFSNYGPRIDVYAPGSGIQSIWNSNENLYDAIPAMDARVPILEPGVTSSLMNNFKKCPGTSMSSPNTVGIIACYAEKYPRMTQADARALIAAVSPETVLSTNGGTLDSKDAGFTYNPASCKKMMFYQGTRHPSNDIGGFYANPYPADNNWIRNTNGQTYPRKNLLNSYNRNSTFQLSIDNPVVFEGETCTVTLTTSNVGNGTKIPYLITGKNRKDILPLITGPTTVSGVFTPSTEITGINLNTKPFKGTRFTTLGGGVGTSTNIPNVILGAASLIGSTPGSPGPLVFTGTQDDGYWTVPLPFPIMFNGVEYTSIFVGTNTYITFTNGSTEWAFLGPSNPPLNKIMITADDNSCQRIYYGIEGGAPQRRFRIRYEGHNDYFGGILGSPTLVYEAIFYEANNNQIDIQVGVNERWVQGSTAYDFDYTKIDKPLTGVLTVNNNNATLPIKLNSNTKYLINFRLDFFSSPNVDIDANDFYN